MKKKILLVFGTRPEAIKMAPLIKKIEESSKLEPIVCITAQHREMLDKVLEMFEIKADYDLDIMQHGQSIIDISNKVLKGVDGVIKECHPDFILVHGDTTTTLNAALAAFYNKVKIGHIEAGLRSGDIYSPFPEEMNRLLTSNLSNYHFSPTEGNKNNLLKENIDVKKIFVTGNTVIDALFSVIDNEYIFDNKELNDIDYKGKKVILLTSHRRENLGIPMENIFKAVREVALLRADVEIIFPMHKNPLIRDIAKNIFKDINRIHLIEPLDYIPFTNLLNKVYLVLTDSGGIQEEAPALGKPVLVLRTETERPEAVEEGTVRIVGTEKDTILKNILDLLENNSEYERMSTAINPYGVGNSSEKIVSIIEKIL